MIEFRDPYSRSFRVVEPFSIHKSIFLGRPIYYSIIEIALSISSVYFMITSKLFITSIVSRLQGASFILNIANLYNNLKWPYLALVALYHFGYFSASTFLYKAIIEKSIYADGVVPKDQIKVDFISYPQMLLIRCVTIISLVLSFMLLHSMKVFG